MSRDDGVGNKLGVFVGAIFAGLGMVAAWWTFGFVLRCLTGLDILSDPDDWMRWVLGLWMMLAVMRAGYGWGQA